MKQILVSRSRIQLSVHVSLGMVLAQVCPGAVTVLWGLGGVLVPQVCPGRCPGWCHGLVRCVGCPVDVGCVLDGVTVLLGV